MTLAQTLTLREAGYVLDRSTGRTASGVVCLGRDAALSERIWSREAGLPGHALYRDFYHKASRVTDRTKSEGKLPYDARLAAGQAERDATIVAAELDARPELVVAAFPKLLRQAWSA